MPRELITKNTMVAFLTGMSSVKIAQQLEKRQKPANQVFEALVSVDKPWRESVIMVLEKFAI